METPKEIDLCQVIDNNSDNYLQQLSMIGLIAGGIAHDFNNILNVISTAASLILLKLPLNNPIRKEIELIENQARSGSDFTKQIVSLLRNDIVEDQKLDLNEIIEKSSAFFSQTIKNINIEKFLQTDLWAVNGQRPQIENVLMNLFINAAQKMAKGGHIRIKTSNIEYIPEDDNCRLKLNKGYYVEVIVSNTGTCMSRNDLKSIINPFFTTKVSEGESGLELSSAAGIMEKHCGTMTVESIPQTGSAFKLYFPAVTYN